LQNLGSPEGNGMNAESKEKYLKAALVVFGVIFCLVYPLGYLWPSGWVWHGGEGIYYLQMIAGVYAVLGVFLIVASRNPGMPASWRCRRWATRMKKATWLAIYLHYCWSQSCSGICRQRKRVRDKSHGLTAFQNR